MRGAEPTELSSVKVNNEVPFCAVKQREQKEQIEKIFLQHGISFYIRWHEKSFFKRMFQSPDEKNVFVICIHDSKIEEAKTLVAGMQDIKILV